MDALPPPDATSRAYSLRSEVIPKPRIQFSSGVKGLHLLLDQFTFFTPAIAYLWGGWRDSILYDFLVTYNQEVHFYHYRFKKPLFRGLHTLSGDTAWNSVLWAIHKKHWDPFVDHVLAAVITDTPKRVLYKFAEQVLEICDPLFLDRQIVVPTQIPLISIRAFGVKANLWVAAFDLEEERHPFMDLPRLKFYGPDEQCKLYARAIFELEKPELAVNVDPVLKEENGASDYDLSTGNASGGET